MRKSLTKGEILRKRSEIKSLFLSRRRYARPGLRLHILSTDLPISRVLVSLSRGFGKAVDRNYTKRVGKEIFRHLKDQLAIGYDIGLVFSPGPYGYQQRFEQIENLLKRARILGMTSL